MAGPRIVLVAVGDELLNGRTVNTNAAWLGGALEREGWRLAAVHTVGDAESAIAGAITDARAAADVVICSGGLGPTEDDRTRQALAFACERPLREEPEVLAALRRRFERGGRSMPASNRRQAMFPEGARVLDNPLGSAPGFRIAGGGAAVFSLPGVPVEFERLANDHVLPWLRRTWPDSPGAPAVRVLRTTGVSESGLADRLEAAAGLRDVAIAFLPGTSGVDLRVQAADAAALERAEAAIAAEVGVALYARADVDLVEVVAAALRARGWRLAAAESCTGGLLAQRVTSFAGASDYFLGGVVAYADRAKDVLAGVPGPLIAAHGAVSAEVARALADGVRRRLGAEAGVAITGVAGPGGGTPAKPVGTVFVAARTPAADEVRELALPGDRAAIRERSAQAALDLLRRSL